MCNLITKILKSLVICYHTLKLIFQDVELGRYVSNNKKKHYLLSHILTVGEPPSDKDVTLNPSVGLYKVFDAKLFCPTSLTICETKVDFPDPSKPNTNTFFSNDSSN